MQPNDIFQAVKAQTAMLVHPAVQPHAAERARHERFMLARLALGAVALALMPGYLLLRGRMELPESLALVAVSLPLLAVVILSRTGRFDWAHAISAGGMTLLVVALALMSGGLASPFLLAFAIVPAEAFFFGAPRLVLRAAALAGAGLALITMRDLMAGQALSDAGSVAATAAAIAGVAVFCCLAQRRRNAEMRGRDAAEARASVLLDNVGDLVTWHDAAGAVLFASRAARSLAGAEPAELQGRGLLQRVHIADRPLFLKALNDAAHGAGRVTASFRVLVVPRGGDGESAPPVAVWLEMNAQRVAAQHAIDGDATDGVAVVCVMRDITGRRALEEEGARIQAEALRANDVKDRFLATVSHELRTPLNAIIGFSDMLRGELGEKLDQACRQEYARIIHDSGQHLLDVVNTLLDVSKIESGVMTLEREPVDIAELARECCALMAFKAGSGQVSLEQVVGADLPSLTADRRALKQVLLNLLSNAVKFTPKGGRVTLAAVRDGGMLDLSVADTGIGIAAGDLPRLGDPFFQAKSAYDRDHEGTGLGLSVVRGLIGLHRGTMTVESAPGAGTRVSVRLPISGAEQGCEPVRIATHARSPRRGLEAKEPFRLTA